MLGAALKPAPVVRGSNTYCKPLASARIGNSPAIVFSTPGSELVENQMLEMKLSGQITRLMSTGAASALGMNRVIPIPSDVNAAVPSSRITIRPGSCAASPDRHAVDG